MQWQGDNDAPFLVGLHTSGGRVDILNAPDAEARSMQGYAGSIAITPDEKRVVVTSPRDGVVQIYSLDNLDSETRLDLIDASGVVASEYGTLVSSG